jgi:hypothetical protein
MDFPLLFEASNCKPVLYKDKFVHISDELPSAPMNKYTLIIEHINSDWEQGIIINSKEAHFRLNDTKEGINSLLIWISEVPKKYIIHIIAPGKTPINIWNMWRIDKGATSYGHNGAAIIIEEIEKGRKYFCNDGYPDDDFDDLILTVTW